MRGSPTANDRPGSDTEPAAQVWNFEGESVSLGVPGERITLVEETTFCISGRSGDILPGPYSPEGLFFRDVRILSEFEVLVNDRQVDNLEISTPNLFTGHFVGRVPSDDLGSILIFRHRYIGSGLREDIELHNSGNKTVTCTLSVKVGVDFADVFEVKEGRSASVRSAKPTHSDVGSLEFDSGSSPPFAGVIIVGVSSGVAPAIRNQSIVFELGIPARSQKSICIQVTPRLAGKAISPRFECGKSVEEATPQQRLEKWRQDTPILTTNHRPLLDVVESGIAELGFLRMFDPQHPQRPLVAAGAPWFMTLFGRDSLLASWMALLADPDLGLGVLQTLADLQGRRDDPTTEEQPGRILHEVRRGAGIALPGKHIDEGDRDGVSGRSSVYYGSIDATPLFVMLLGELRRWGLAGEEVDALLPCADAALNWILKYGDRDGDGYVEYERTSPTGLINQGWKDSPDAICFADGRLAKAPIALCEVQGYVYAAFRARYHFALEAGNEVASRDWLARADHLKAKFNEDFWIPSKGYYALALDGAKQPVDALASNMGHCLWTGIIDEAHAESVADMLMSDDLFTGWGIRTLGRSMARYNPVSYHLGAVWPHDTAIAAAGMMRYGFVPQATRLIKGIVEAGASRNGRLPELFTGISAKEFPTVVSYPTSCSPQAWAAASPLLLLRTILGFEPSVARKRLWVRPALPEGVTELNVSNIRLNNQRLTVEIKRDEFSVQGDLGDIVLIKQRRPFYSPD